jgi:hypothetical protein
MRKWLLIGVLLGFSGCGHVADAMVGGMVGNLVHGLVMLPFECAAESPDVPEPPTTVHVEVEESEADE